MDPNFRDHSLDISVFLSGIKTEQPTRCLRLWKQYRINLILVGTSLYGHPELATVLGLCLLYNDKVEVAFL